MQNTITEEIIVKLETEIEIAKVLTELIRCKLNDKPISAEIRTSVLTLLLERQLEKIANHVEFADLCLI